MLIDGKLFPKLDRISRSYDALRYRRVGGVAMEYFETTDHLRAEPSDVSWQAMPPGAGWGGDWLTRWFRGDFEVPSEADGQALFVRPVTGAAETMVMCDGAFLGMIDGAVSNRANTNHYAVRIVARAVAGTRHHLCLEAYCTHSRPGTQPVGNDCLVRPDSCCFEGVELLCVDAEVKDFVEDLIILRQIADALDGDSLRRHRIFAALRRVFALVEQLPEAAGRERWLPGVRKAHAELKPLIGLRNGPTVPTVGLIGHSHLDTAWLWTVEETTRKCARTFSSVLNLMDQYPEFIFLQSAPYHADVTRREYPSIFKGIRERVAEGRWEPNGGMWVEPDCNIPSGEALVRQLLVGQAAIEEMFGRRSDTLWLPDVFGYSAALPQILQGAGIRYFCTTKMSWGEIRFPYESFWWEGIDGTRVLSHFNGTHQWPDPAACIRQWRNVQHKEVQDRLLLAFGFGDGGGGPHAEMLDRARKIGDVEGCPRTRYVTLSDFMRELEATVCEAPVWNGELYLSAHRGTLTSQAQIKRGNRLTELALREAEFLWTQAALAGAGWPREQLADLWKDVLLYQFHDILPGTSIREVNEAVVTRQGEVLDALRALSRQALDTLTPTLNAGATHLELWNTLSWARRGTVELPGDVRPSGAELVCQPITGLDGTARTLVGELTIPALGRVTVPLASAGDGVTAPAASAFLVSDTAIESPLLRLGLERGRVTEVFDKVSQRWVVRPGEAFNRFLIGEDIPGGWDNWDLDYDQALKMGPDWDLRESEVVADGPLQLRLRGRYRLGAASEILQDMILHADSPQIDFETRLDWHETHRFVKVLFTMDVTAAEARHEIQYGHLRRPTHASLKEDRVKFEVCAHKWTDLADSGYGVALLNDCKYGVSVEGSTIGLSLLKSGTHPDARGDAGVHLFRYALRPHAGAFSVPTVVRPAYELNVPVLTRGVGTAAPPASLLEVDAPNVVVEAVKWAEDGGGYVVRLYEAGEASGRARVHFAEAPAEVVETNLLEEEIRPLELRDSVLELQFRPFEIKTLYCRQPPISQG